MAGKHTIYVTDAEWKILEEAREKIGLSISHILVKGSAYWMKNNPSELEDLATKLESRVTIRDVKTEETSTGDYVWSFQKKKQKIAEIKKLVRDGDISEKRGDFLIEKTERGYSTSHRASEELMDSEETGKKEKKKRHRTEEEWDRIRKQKESERIVTYLFKCECGEEFSRRYKQSAGILTGICPNCDEVIPSIRIQK